MKKLPLAVLLLVLTVLPVAEPPDGVLASSIVGVSAVNELDNLLG